MEISNVAWLVLAVVLATALILIIIRRLRKAIPKDEAPSGNRYVHFFTLGSICGDRALVEAEPGLSADGAGGEILAALNAIGVSTNDPALTAWGRLEARTHRTEPAPGTGEIAQLYVEAAAQVRERVGVWGELDDRRWFQLGRLLREMPWRAATAEKRSQKRQVVVQAEALEGLANQVQLPLRLKSELTDFALLVKGGEPGQDYELKARDLAGRIRAIL